MPNFSNENILNVTKKAISQCIDKGFMDETSGNLTALDDHFIIDLGKKLELDENGEITEKSPADIFFKSLLSTISKITVDTREYVAQLPKLFVDVSEYGIISEYVKIDISDIMIDEMWNGAGFINYSSDGGTAYGERIAAIEHGCYKPVVNVKIYKQAKALMVPLTIPYDQIFTAFHGVDEYNKFITGLYISVNNTIALKAEVYGLMCVSMGIAKAKANGNEINLLAEYKELYPNSTLTATTALRDNSFMQFALSRIAETKDYLKRFTGVYNNHESITFSSETNMILLTKFANAAKFGVRANTYNENLLGVGDYDKVSNWQAIQQTSNPVPYNFYTASSIRISENAAKAAGFTSQSGNLDITGVVGVIYDRYAMAVTVDKKKTTSKYIACSDVTNYFNHHLINYIVNDNYPIVTFVIRDET